MKLIDELRWLRANYAAGNTTEINERLDRLIAAETDPEYIRLSDALELLMLDDRNYYVANSRANGIIINYDEQQQILAIIEINGVRYVNRLTVEYLTGYRS